MSFVYAVEQTLDNYKFNLLKNKQTFISQMKNSALHVRTIDEGALDEKSGMNFSEYIAILSGDTSLLEKSKLEKKIAVMESLRGAHYREVSTAKWKLESTETSAEQNRDVLAKLSVDDSSYKGLLRLEKDGTKANPIQLDRCHSADPEAIGKFIIQLYKDWRPPNGLEQQEKIGRLYGFDLYIRDLFDYKIEGQVTVGKREHGFYAANPATGTKYTYNGGAPNMDNPKLAARYFLNAIDRIPQLRARHEGDLRQAEKEIPVLREIVEKPFEKEDELRQMKTQLNNLERTIALKITEKQMKQDGELDDIPQKGKRKAKQPAEVVPLDSQEAKPLRRAR
jgi:hypothetical protein